MDDRIDSDCIGRLRKRNNSRHDVRNKMFCNFDLGGGASTTTVQNNDPWKGQQDYLTYGFEQARDIYDNATPQYYPDSTIAPQSTSTRYGLYSLENRGMYGNEAMNDAQKQLQSTINGDYIGSANLNPYFDQARGSIDSQFAGAGRYGSGMHQTALAEKFGQIAANQYNTERQQQLDAINSAPTFAAADYNDINAILQTGAARDSYAQSQLNADIDRYNYDQTSAQSALADYMRMIQGNYGSSATTVGTQKQSTMDQVLGIASMALPFLSDARLKENIVYLGERDGLPIYEWSYKGSSERHIGPMAQDVQKVNPDAVVEQDGYLALDLRAL